MIKFLFRILPYIIIFIFSLYYVKQIFKQDFLFATEEKSLINYDYVNYRFQYLWNFSENFGAVTPSVLSKITLGNFWRLGQFLNLDLVKIQRLFYFAVIYLTLIFTYSGFKQINKDKLSSLILSFVYVTGYNYYALFDTSPKLIHFLLMPMSVFLWHRYLSLNKTIYLILHFFLVILLMSVSINPPQMMGAYGFIFFYLLILFMSRKNFIRIILFLFPYLLIIISVFVLNQLVFKYSGGIKSFDPLKIAWTSTNSRLYDIYRIFGSWWDYAGADGLPYNHLIRYYHSRSGIIISFIPFILALFLLYKKSLQNKIRETKILLILFIFILLAKGTTPPLDFIFDYFYNFNYFKIFREPWAKFIPSVYFTLLLLIAYSLKNVSLITKKIMALSISLVLIFNPYPLAKGIAIYHSNEKWKILDAKIPDYWLNFYQWSKENLADKRVLVLPQTTDNTPLIHTWNPLPFRSNPEVYFLNANIITSAYVTREDGIIMKQFMENLNPGLLSLTSIDYVLWQKDIQLPEMKKFITLDKISTVLDYRNKLNFGKLELYPVNNQLLTPKLRPATKVLLGSEKCNSNTLNNQIVSIKNPVEITKINEVEYRIEIPGKSSTNFGLFFASTYNRGWKLYDSPWFFAKPVIAENQHSKANCYFNYWDIPSSLTNNATTLFLRYEPQIIYEKYKLLFLSISICYLGILIWYGKRKYN